MKAEPVVCQECHSSFESAGGYHSFLYCELIKLGHRDPEAYLRSCGFERVDAMRALPVEKRMEAMGMTKWDDVAGYEPGTTVPVWIEKNAVD